KIACHVNSLHEPVVFIPSDWKPQYWPADSGRVRAYLSAAYNYLSDGGFLRENERKCLIDLLIEECYGGGRYETELDDPGLDKSVLAQALIAFMNTHAVFEGRTAELRNELTRDSVKRLVPRVAELPALTTLFSRHLNREREVLRTFGIELKIRHTE